MIKINLSIVMEIDSRMNLFQLIPPIVTKTFTRVLLAMIDFETISSCSPVYDSYDFSSGFLFAWHVDHHAPIKDTNRPLDLRSSRTGRPEEERERVIMS